MPPMELQRPEARSLAVCLKEVQKHYPNVRIMSEKQMALLALALCAGNIYIPRAMQVTGMKKFEPKSPPAKPAQVTTSAPIPVMPQVNGEGAVSPFAASNPVMATAEEALKFFDPAGPKQ